MSYTYHNYMEYPLLRVPGRAIPITPVVERCAICGSTQYLSLRYDVRLCRAHAAQADVRVERARRAHATRQDAARREHLQRTIGWPPRAVEEE